MKPKVNARLLLSSILLGVFTALLHNNGRGANHTENNLSIVEAYLPRAGVCRVVAQQ
jgi:hypothetical protein